MNQPKYKRVLLKISGEALAGAEHELLTVTNIDGRGEQSEEVSQLHGTA